MSLLRKRNQLSPTSAVAICGDCKRHERFVSVQVSQHWFHTCLNCGRRYKDGVAQVFTYKGPLARARSISDAVNLSQMA